MARELCRAAAPGGLTSRWRRAKGAGTVVPLRAPLPRDPLAPPRYQQRRPAPPPCGRSLLSWAAWAIVVAAGHPAPLRCGAAAAASTTSPRTSCRPRTPPSVGVGVSWQACATVAETPTVNAVTKPPRPPLPRLLPGRRRPNGAPPRLTARAGAVARPPRCRAVNACAAAGGTPQRSRSTAAAANGTRCRRAKLRRSHRGRRRPCRRLQRSGTAARPRCRRRHNSRHGLRHGRRCPSLS